MGEMQYRTVYIPEDPEHESWSKGKTPEEISDALRVVGPNHYENHVLRRMPLIPMKKD